MNIEVRAYTDNDIEAMVTIWNQVVEDGVAFPQEECLTPESGTAFFAEQTYCGVAEDTDTAESTACTSCIRTMLDDVDTSAMQAMRSTGNREDCISARSWCLTVWRRARHMVTVSYSSMRLSQVMCMHDICMSVLDSNSLVRYRVASA